MDNLTVSSLAKLVKSLPESNPDAILRYVWIADSQLTHALLELEAAKASVEIAKAVLEAEISQAAKAVEKMWSADEISEVRNNA